MREPGGGTPGRGSRKALPEPDFHAPPWSAPLDVSACLAAVPAEPTVKGLLILPMLAEAQRRGLTLAGARARYLPFFDYPLAHHVRLLVDAAQAFFPEVSTRQGLRKLGRAAQAAVVETIVGKVVWASVDSVEGAIDCLAKFYEITTSSTRLVILERAPGSARVRLEGVHAFIDSHHVGVFEGAMRGCGAKETAVAVRVVSPSDAEFLLTWAIAP